MAVTKNGNLYNDGGKGRLLGHASVKSGDAITSVPLKIHHYQPKKTCTSPPTTPVEQDLRSIHDGVFPLLSLPQELRFEIYRYLTTAPDLTPAYRQIVSHRTPTGRPLGRIIVKQLAGKHAKLSTLSGRPSLTFLRANRQLHTEGTQTLYETNEFEVTARTKTTATYTIFRLPGGLDPTRVRFLRLVTHAQVGSLQGCNTWSILARMSALRAVWVAMKTPFAPHRMDFMSCVEMLDMMLWLGPSVEVGFGIAGTLPRFCAAPWVGDDVLLLYLRRFELLRGLKLSAWTHEKKDCYLSAVRIAEGFI